MEVKELYDLLSELIREGKGYFRVNIECLDGYSEHANTIHIDDKCEEIEIVGA